jgi:hypothetical protein
MTISVMTTPHDPKAEKCFRAAQQASVMTVSVMTVSVMTGSVTTGSEIDGAGDFIQHLHAIIWVG